MHTIIDLPRFYAREFTPSEENLYLELYRDGLVTHFINDRSAPERKKRFAEGLAQYEDGLGFGRWAIINRDDHDFIGVCRLELINKIQHRAELGYVLHQKYWGKGIASDVVKNLVVYAFKNTGAAEITALTHLTNFASQRVLEKAGFMRLDNIFIDGEERAFFMTAKDHQ